MKLQIPTCEDVFFSSYYPYLAVRKQLITVGPLLFLMFINDLPLFLQSTSTYVDLYAYDTTIYYIDQDKSSLERQIQSSLDSLQKWCR